MRPPTIVILAALFAQPVSAQPDIAPRALEATPVDHSVLDGEHPYMRDCLGPLISPPTEVRSARRDFGDYRPPPFDFKPTLSEWLRVIRDAKLNSHTSGVRFDKAHAERESQISDYLR